MFLEQVSLHKGFPLESGFATTIDQTLRMCWLQAFGAVEEVGLIFGP